MVNVAVIGTTSWGTTLAVLLSQKGHAVTQWARTQEEAATLNAARENRQRLPGVAFPAALHVSADLSEVMAGVELVLVVVPSQRMRENARQFAAYVPANAMVMSAAKGLELHTAIPMSQVLREELPEALRDRCGVLSGPNIAREVAQGMPSATVIAADDPNLAEAARDLVMTPRFRVYSSHDVIGVELGGALKNIVALGAGMGDGWGYGANAKAAFMTRGLAEITRLGVAAGANPLTFLGMSGLGDLVATCTSPFSRNRTVGEQLAKGRRLADIMATLGGTAEGVTTTPAARELGRRLNVEMPITEEAYRVLYEGLDPQQVMQDLMSREPRYELEGMGG